MKTRFKSYVLLFALPVLFVAVGCSTYETQSREMRQAWQSGDVATAARLSEKLMTENKDSNDSLIWMLEAGTVARARGDFLKSRAAFDKAKAAFTTFENEPEIKLLEEASSLLTNQSCVPYKGYNYDKIMAMTYQAMNYMESGDFAHAAPHFIALERYQQNAVKKNRARIEKEERALKETAKEKKAKAYDSRKTLSTPEAKKKFSEIYGADFSLTGNLQQAKAVYTNPFAYWIAGVYFANKGLDASDRNRASSLFRIGGEMLGGKSKVFAEDYAMARELVKLQKIPNRITYVVYETGSAPIRKQVRIDLPLFIMSKNASYVGINFPVLEEQKSFAPNLKIISDGKVRALEVLADMDKIVRQEFNDALPKVVARSIISSAAKATAQLAVAKSVGSSEAALAVNLVGSFYQAATNDADLRMWTTLPKQIKVARFPTPENGKIQIGSREIRVSRNGVNIVFAKRMSSSGKLLLRSFSFSKKSPEKNGR